MPQALVFVAPTVFGASATALGGSLALVTAAGGLTLLGTAVSIGGTLLLSVATASLAGAQNVKSGDVQQTIKQPTAARIVHMGRSRTGGAVVFARQRWGNLYYVVIFAHGEADAIEKFYLNKAIVTLDEDGNVTDDQYHTRNGSQCQIISVLGTDDQVAFDLIQHAFPGWDDDHKLNGLVACAYNFSGVQQEDFQSVYPQGIPSPELLLRGIKIPDPRTGETAWSENAALHIAELIQSPDGFNRPGRVNAARLTRAANDCDDAVPLAAGGTEPRWRFGGPRSLATKPGSVLSKMMDCCAGRVSLMPDATFAIDVGKWRVPEVTLTADDIIEMTSWTDGPDLLDRYNELQFTYTDQSLNFSETSGDPWDNEAQQTTDGEILQSQSVADLGFCPSHSQGRRAAKIKQSRENPEEVYTLRCQPSAIIAMYERYIALDASIILASGYFEVMSYDLNLQDGSITYVLNRVDAEAFAWSTAEEGVPQALPTPAESSEIPAPTNFIAVPQGIQTAENAFTAGVGCAWDAPSFTSLSPRLQYRKTGDSSWILASVGSDATSAEISPLQQGVSYDFRMAWKDASGKNGDYAYSNGIEASATTDAPAAPTGLTVTDNGSSEALVEVTCASSENLWKTQVFRDGTLAATFYSNPGIVASFVDATGPGTFAYTARSINVAGAASATDAGPITATIL